MEDLRAWADAYHKHTGVHPDVITTREGWIYVDGGTMDIRVRRDMTRSERWRYRFLHPVRAVRWWSRRRQSRKAMARMHWVDE